MDTRVHGLVTAHKILPAQTHNKLSINLYAGRQPLLISLLAKYQLSNMKSGVCHTQAPNPSRNYECVTHAFGVTVPWFLAVAPGDMQEGGQGTDLLSNVFCHAPATRAARALVRGCISIMVLNSHRWLLPPFIQLNPFQSHLYFCPGEFANLIRCI